VLFQFFGTVGGLDRLEDAQAAVFLAAEAWSEDLRPKGALIFVLSPVKRRINIRIKE
jgi:hypothetical protein